MSGAPLLGTASSAADVTAEAAARLQGDLPTTGSAYSGGRESFPRGQAGNAAGATMSSQLLRGTYLTADRSESIGSLAVCVGATAASATPTLCRLGLWTVAGNGNLTLVASTPNDTSLFAVANTIVAKALSTPYSVTVGVRYAICGLVVTAGTPPTFVNAALNVAMLNAAPILGGNYAGQADLPASPTAANMASAGSGTRIWAAMVPA